jgi:hypothetical protein
LIDFAHAAEFEVIAHQFKDYFGKIPGPKSYLAQTDLMDFDSRCFRITP